MQQCSGRVRMLARLGEVLMASLMVYSGVMHFKFASFVAGVVPKWLPWHLFWAYFTGVALFAAGISILLRKRTALAATLLGIMLSLFVLLIHVPSMINSIVHKPENIAVLWSFNGTGGVNNALKDTALVFSAFILACASSTRNNSTMKIAERTLGVSLALVMVAFGIEHFIYKEFTPGVPSWSFVTFWIPWRPFWGYITGAAMLIGGVMIIARKKQSVTAAATGIMILSVAVLVYAFRVAAHLGSYSELTNTVKDVAVAGGLLVLAGVLPLER